VEYRELAICVDIGGTNTSIGLVDANGDCATTSTMDTRATDQPSIFVRRLCREIELLREKVQSSKSFKGIGIASPAAIFHTVVIDHPANFGWGSVDIVKMMKEYYDLPVTITNDGNAAALGEMEFGIARGLRNFVEITIGTGVGSGIVVDSRLLLGGFGWGGEMGHVIVNEGGRECGCGRAGCLETYVSASGICRTAFELLAVRNTASELRNISLSKLTSEAIHHHARKGDSIALEAFNVAGGIL